MNITMLLIYINMRRFGRGNYFVCPEGGNEVPGGTNLRRSSPQSPWRRKWQSERGV